MITGPGPTEAVALRETTHVFDFLRAQPHNRRDGHLDRPRVAAEYRGANRAVKVAEICSVYLGEKALVEIVPLNTLSGGDGVLPPCRSDAVNAPSPRGDPRRSVC